MKKILKQVITSKTKFFIPLLLLSLTLLFCLTAVSAASGDTIYVNRSGGNDSWDGQSAVYDNTTGSGPKLSIKNATGAVNNGGTIYIANGEYTGENNINITIYSDMTFIGESREGTIINPKGQGRIFQIYSGTVTLENLTLTNGYDGVGGNIWNRATLNIKNVTLTGGMSNEGGAIYNAGVLTITDSTFSGNDASWDYKDGDTYEGGAIFNLGTLTINNSVFTGNTACHGGAIVNRGGILHTTTADINNCTFTDNSVIVRTGRYFVGGGHGGAILNYAEYGNLIVHITNCTFTGNHALRGGAISNVCGRISGNTADLSINNCTFTDNYVGYDFWVGMGGGLGGAIYNGAADGGIATLNVINSTFTGTSVDFSALYAGAIFNVAMGGGSIATLNVIGSTFKDNKVTYNNFLGFGGLGGAICNEADSGGSANMDITDSTFTGNYASDGGGAIFTHVLDLGTAIVHVNFNRFFGNSLDYTIGSHGIDICEGTNGTVDVDNSWWGNNTPDFSQLLYGIPDPDSWLVMNATASPLSIRVGDTSTITVTILSYNKTSNSYSPVAHCAPIPTIFTATLGDMNPGSAFIIPNLGIDQLISLFTSTQEGTAVINATVDYETVIFSIQASKTLTNITVLNVTGYYGNNATLTAILKDDQGHPISGETIHFSVNFKYIGDGITDNTGTATIDCPLNFDPDPDPYTIFAILYSNNKYNASIGTGNLTVNINPTTVSVGDVVGYYGDTATLTAILKNSQGQPVSGETVYFNVNNNNAGSAITNDQGIATIYNYQLNLVPGPYNINATFNGDSNYTSSTGLGTLTIDKIPTTITVNSPTGYNGDLVDIIATLIRTDTGAAVIGKPVTITVNGQTYTDITDSNGQITWMYTINNLDADPYTITPIFAGDTQCEASNGAGTLTVKKIITILNLNSPIGYNGDTVNIIATLNRPDTHTAIAGKFVTITMNGQTYQGNTDANGQLTWTYTINNMDAGFYDIFAAFAGDTQYRNSDDGDLLMVKKIPTSLTVSNAGGVGIFKGQTVNISAILIDTVHGNSPVSGKQIDFYVNNVLVPGPVFTNASGVVTLVYQIVQDAGIYSIHVVFAGDNQYLNSTSNPDGTLTVDKTPINVIVTSAHNFAGQNVTLTANVTDYYGNSVNEGSVKFTVNGSYVNTVSVNNGEVTLNWTIPSDLSTGNYNILAEYLGTGNFSASNSTGNLTVDATPTSIIIGNFTGINSQIVSLNVTLTDAYGHPLTGKTINFKIDGNSIGSGTTDSNGIATLNYKLNSAGNFTVTVEFAGDSGYVNSTGNGTLTVDPSSDLYIIITSNKNNPKVGETFTLTYKLGNNGPDAAENVTITVPLPEGFKMSDISGNGDWTYDASTNKITWTLANVPVGDPYLYITGKVTKAGTYVFSSSISSETYNINSEGVTPITIKAVNEVKAASKTILLQKTGLPLVGLVLAVLAVFGGFAMPKRKN